MEELQFIKGLQEEAYKYAGLYAAEKAKNEMLLQYFRMMIEPELEAIGDVCSWLTDTEREAEARHQICKSVGKIRKIFRETDE